MDTQLIYIAIGIVALLWGVILPFFFIRRGNQIKKQKKLLSIRDNSAEKYQVLEDKFSSFQEQTNTTTQSLKEEIEDLKNALLLKERNLNQFAERFINDQITFLIAQVTSSNYVETKNKLEEVFDFCTAHDFKDEETLSNAKKILRKKFEEIVRKDLDKQSQNETSEQIRDERSFQEKVKFELERLEKEKEELHEELNKAVQVADEKLTHQLQLKINRIEEHIERASEQSNTSTTSGFVYVLSNYGSLGEGVFKIGYTQSFTPQEEIKKISNASTPFPYDVHALISSKHAENLYKLLQQELQKYSVNRVNLTKDFYAVELEKIIAICEKMEGKVSFQLEPEALEYFQSMETSAEDLAYLADLKNKKPE